MAALKPLFSHSVNHCTMTDKGVTVQVVLPGATATDLWKRAGTPVERLPQEIVMAVEDMVDAALAGARSREFVTILALLDAGQWQTYEGARQAMMPNFVAHNGPVWRRGRHSGRRSCLAFLRGGAIKPC
jgi:short-subunit dehydrogenase